MGRLRRYVSTTAAVTTALAGCTARSPERDAATTVAPAAPVVPDADIRILDVGSGDSRVVAGSGKLEDFPTWSPDGRRIAFHRLESGDLVDGNADLWTVEVATGELVPALARPEVDVTPSWSPDGQHLVFMSIGDDPDLWVLDLSDLSLRQLTDDPAGDFVPTFSPDGTQVAFLRRRADHQTVWLMPVAPEEAPHQVSPDEFEATSLAWSPSGDEIAYVGHAGNGLPQLRIVDLRGDVRTVDDLIAPGHPSWSPDGTSLVVTDDADGHLHRVDLGTGTVTQLTDDDSDDRNASWSPDGRYIAYVAYPNPGDSG